MLKLPSFSGRSSAASHDIYTINKALWHAVVFRAVRLLAVSIEAQREPSSNEWSWLERTSHKLHQRQRWICFI